MHSNNRGICEFFMLVAPYMETYTGVSTARLGWQREVWTLEISILSKLGRSAMAPQRQKRKLGLSRMDAAVDAMLPYGFAESHVRKVVKLLLEVYGGNEGWPFIEEFSYKELIEALLRDVEARDEMTAGEHRNTSQIDTDNENLAGPSGTPEDSTLQGAAQVLLGLANPTTQKVDCNSRGTDLWQTSRQKGKEISAAARNNGGEPTAAATSRQNEKEISAAARSNDGEPMAAATSRQKGKEISAAARSNDGEPMAVVTSRQKGKEIGAAARNNDGEPTAAATSWQKEKEISASARNNGCEPTAGAHLGRQSSTPGPASPSPTPQVNKPPTTRKLPCYGWIDSDEEDADEFMD